MDYRGHRLSGAHFDTAEFSPQIVIVTELSCVTQTLSTHCRRVDFFSVRLLSVLRGHSVCLSPPQRSMTSDFEGFSIPDFTHYIYFPILILEKEPVFSLLNVQC